MSNIDSPAGSTGGPVTVPARTDLPEKMRVHALAKMLVRTSREVLAALADLGVEARSAQSSIDRRAAEQVIVALAVDVADVPVKEAAEEAGAQRAPLFASASPLFQPPTPPTPPARVRHRAAEPDTATNESATATNEGRRDEAAREEPESADETTSASSEDSDDDDADSASRRRRRRGRRGRGRGRGGEDLDDEGGEDAGTDGAAADETGSGAESESGDDTEDDADQADTGGSRRRRRRRRRKSTGEDSADTGDDADPPDTVTRVRQPREQRADSDDEGDGVQGVRGSTRLEAKRQRRRDGRDAGRRRVPILSEAEFLARRESVDRSMVVRERGDRVEIAVLEDEILIEHFVAGRDGGSMVGNIYLGRVQNVLPSMEAAFVDIGRGRNAVLYAGEVDWDAAGLGGKARRIEQALSSGDSVLVQVTKDPVGHKGARLTTQISLAGRFLVYVPSGGAAGISRKLPDVERRRLKDMLKEIVPSEAGVIIRTASEGVSYEALERDVRRLQAQWEVVKAKSEQTGPNKPKAPVLLYEEPDLIIKVVSDQFNEDFSRLVVSGDDAWDTLANYVGHVAPELADRLHRHVGPADVFAEYRIDEQLLKALDRKVWLPSGGTLGIDRTEAMTVIDVNTGKFTGSGGNLEETVTRNNLEAAEEIVRQLRLRDVGGIIVIDFIDMVLEANRDLVLRRLTECLSRDRTRHQVAEVTSLGLVQMTRKRVGGGLLEHFSTPCEECRGRGVLVTTEPVTAQRDDGERSERSEGDGSGRRSRGGRNRRGDGEDGGGRSGSPAAAVEVSPVPATPAAPAPVPASIPSPPVVAAPVAEAPVGAVAPTPADVEDHRNGHAQPPRQRRGRVTRTAGAPASATGDAPVAAVVTVPATPTTSAAGSEQVVPVAVPPQPEPTATVRPRRSRRAAARPAGPPAADDADSHGGGDPD